MAFKKRNRKGEKPDALDSAKKAFERMAPGYDKPMQSETDAIRELVERRLPQIKHELSNRLLDMATGTSGVLHMMLEVTDKGMPQPDMILIEEGPEPSPEGFKPDKGKTDALFSSVLRPMSESEVEEMREKIMARIKPTEIKIDEKHTMYVWCFKKTQE